MRLNTLFLKLSIKFSYNIIGDVIPFSRGTTDCVEGVIANDVGPSGAPVLYGSHFYQMPLTLQTYSVTVTTVTMTPKLQ